MAHIIAHIHIDMLHISLAMLLLLNLRVRIHDYGPALLPAEFLFYTIDSFLSSPQS